MCAQLARTEPGNEFVRNVWRGDAEQGTRMAIISAHETKRFLEVKAVLNLQLFHSN
jgi:hypothetical protein